MREIVTFSLCPPYYISLYKVHIILHYNYKPVIVDLQSKDCGRNLCNLTKGTRTEFFKNFQNRACNSKRDVL